MLQSIDMGKLWELLSYDADSPLIFSSGLFLFLFAFFSLFYSFTARRVLPRIIDRKSVV